MQPESRSRQIWIVILILAASAFLAAAPLMWAGSGNGAQEGGGDNPVVGSLPCAVDPDMDLKFWKALGRSPQSGTILRPLPTLAFAGSSALSRSIVDAWGSAGSVNAGRGCWSLLGLMQQGGMVTTRSQVLTSQALLWTWLPQSLIGGRVTMVSNIGPWTATVTDNCLALPLPTLCSAGPLVPVDATFSVCPPGSVTPTVKYRVTVIADVVTVTFL